MADGELERVIGGPGAFAAQLPGAGPTDGQTVSPGPSSATLTNRRRPHLAAKKAAAKKKTAAKTAKTPGRGGDPESAGDPGDAEAHGGDGGARSRDGDLRPSRRRGDRLGRRHRPVGGGGLRGDLRALHQWQRGHRGPLADAGGAGRQARGRAARGSGLHGGEEPRDAPAIRTAGSRTRASSAATSSAPSAPIGPIPSSPTTRTASRGSSTAITARWASSRRTRCTRSRAIICISPSTSCARVSSRTRCASCGTGGPTSPTSSST